MEEILNCYGSEISQMAKQCKSEDHTILPIAKEMFSDQITITRIAFLLVFAKKLMEEYPEKKDDIYEDIFNALYSSIKF